MCNTDERLKKKKELQETTQRKVVGAVGFEPTTSCSQGRHANQAALRPDDVMNYQNDDSYIQNFYTPCKLF